MGEIEKLYDTVGIRPRRKCEFYEDCPYGFGHSCDNCDIEFTKFNSSYPPLTAEKQLELTRWLGKKEYTVRINFHENEWGIATECYSGYFQDNLAEALSSIINTIWQDLTEEEKQQIKEILE